MILINDISYLDPYVYGGGGELFHRELLRRAPSNVVVRRLHALGRQDHLHNSPDVIILLDVFNAPAHAALLPQRLASRTRLLRAGKYRRQVESIVFERDVRISWFHNAYVDICDRPYFPCNGDASEALGMCSCPDVPAGRHFIRGDDGAACFAEYSVQFLRQASQQWFVSPLHEACWSCRVPLSNLPDGASFNTVLPGIVPFDFIASRLPDSKRDIDLLFVGSFTESKGSIEILERFGNSVVICGTAPDWVRNRGVQVIEWLPSGEVARLMGRSRKLVLLPQWPEPFGRVVAEAALAGCELITNGNVGATSWDVDLSDPSIYSLSIDECWRKLISGLGTSGR